MQSGELARLCGVSTDTLRHYERIGVLPRPARTASGYRKYSPEAAARVRLIRGALAVGFTLEELRRILRVRDSGGAPCRQVRSLAAEKLAQIEDRLDELARLRDSLRRILADWDTRLAANPPGRRAGLLETLLSEIPATE